VAKGVLAIAAPRFGSTSETFIREHVRALGPERMILICQDGEGALELGPPVLADIEDVSPKSGLRRAAASFRRRWQRHVDPRLISSEAGRVAAYLSRHHATALLAEYGNFACKFIDLCERLQLPLIAHFHGWDASMLLRDPPQLRHYGRLFAAAAAIVCPSAYLADRLRGAGCPPAKLHVCPYGIDPDRFPKGKARSPRQFLAVGRLVEKKAPHLTIAAFARVAEAFPDAVLHVVGDGRLRELCERTIEAQGLQAAVRMHGARPHTFVADLMESSAVFVQHSVEAASGDTEGLPVAILEAMMAGMAVVATRHAGIPESVESGANGILVDERDVAGMAEAMRRLAENPGLAERFGEEGRRRALQRYARSVTEQKLRQVVFGEADPQPCLTAAGDVASSRSRIAHV